MFIEVPRRYYRAGVQLIDQQTHDVSREGAVLVVMASGVGGTEYKMGTDSPVIRRFRKAFDRVHICSSEFERGFLAGQEDMLSKTHTWLVKEAGCFQDHPPAMRTTLPDIVRGLAGEMKRALLESERR